MYRQECKTCYQGNPQAPLAQGIRDVMAGKVWLDQEQLQTALRTEVEIPPDHRARPFTEREQQVLSCVFEGLANKEDRGSNRSLREFGQSHSSATLFQDWSSDAESIGTYRLGATPGSALVSAASCERDGPMLLAGFA
jgi:hypothetical protein